jgi:hypothetical protein
MASRSRRGVKFSDSRFNDVRLRAQVVAAEKEAEREKQEEKNAKAREYYQENKEKILTQKRIKKIERNRRDLEEQGLPLFLDKWVSIKVTKDRETGELQEPSYSLLFKDKQDLASFLFVTKFKSEFETKEMLSIMKAKKGSE